MRLITVLHNVDAGLEKIKYLYTKKLHTQE